MHGELLWRAKTLAELEKAAEVYLSSSQLTHAWTVKHGIGLVLIGLRA
jgi:hypothetical protein|tara:strand:- start:130 stop:273 length:144 start_codon:yes stop_codon:yes gene_type:complete